MLLELDEIQQRLNQEFAETPEIPELPLYPSTLLPVDLEELESFLKVNLPSSFRDVILKYDYGNLSIGGVWFGQSGDYARFLAHENDTNQEYPWWEDEGRPHQYLLVAESDGYIILLNIESGEILSYLRTQTWREGEMIASNFELFVRAVGTVYLEEQATIRGAEFMRDICKQTGCALKCRFWAELVEGIA